MKSLFYDVSLLDKKTRVECNLSEDLMMEHAALSIKNKIKALFPPSSSVLILTGSGNNGADGFALARLLYDYDVTIFEVLEPKSELCKLQKSRCDKTKIHFTTTLENRYSVVVDAIFGTGLNKQIDAKTEAIIQNANSTNGYKIACDIPSGLTFDGLNATFIADLTVTMGAAKVALFGDNAKDFVGKVVVADLGVSYLEYTKNTKPDAYLLETTDMLLPTRTNQSSHKGDYGHLAVYVGDKEGAGVLSGMAALSFGAGLVTLISKEKINAPADLMQSDSLPNNTTAICLGSGLGKAFSSGEITDLALQKLHFVLDADMFYKNELLDFLDSSSILTPHPKEFASLLEICNFGKYSIEHIQQNRFELAKKFSEKYPQIVLVLKGANTIIANNGELYICHLGSVSLAKGGSGDVLAGMIGALLGQGYEPLSAAKSGVLAHALASQNIKNNYALTPSDLIEAVKSL